MRDTGMASSGDALAGPRGRVLDRLLGVLLLRAAAYREIVDDRQGTRQAMLIVLGVALVRSLVRAITRARAGDSTALLPEGYGIPQGYMLDLPAGVSPTTLFIGRIVVGLLFARLFWSAGARMLWLVSRFIFHAPTDRGMMLRVTGYTHFFTLLGLIPVVGPLLGLVLQAVGNTIGIREAARSSTGTAILTAVLAFVFTLLLIVLISVVVTVIVIASIRGGS